MRLFIAKWQTNDFELSFKSITPPDAILIDVANLNMEI